MDQATEAGWDTTREVDLLALAVWARARAMRSRIGDIATPADLRAFARECSEQSRRAA